MWRHTNANLTDLIVSVSEAMDLADPSVVDHQIRTAYVCGEMARAARLDYPATERLIVAALLHDIGALSPEEKIGIHHYEDLRPEPHCLRGAKLFGEAAWLEPSSLLIEWHHTPMSKHRSEGRDISNPYVLGAQMLFLADHLERAIDRSQYILHQCDALRQRVYNLENTSVHTDLIALFDQISFSEDFWLELVSKSLASRLRERSVLRSLELDFETARSIASVFKDMTDFRSRFTASHSVGVACCACGIAKRLSFSGRDLQHMELAGLLHDIGKLVVPNSILCKPGKLIAEEYAVVRQHSYHSHRILAGIRGFEQVAEWAGRHHERTDGSGYPERLDGKELSLGAEILAVADVATALSEKRHYRPPFDEKAVLATLREMSGKKQLASVAVEVFADHYTEIMNSTKDRQADTEARYSTRYASIV